MNNTTEAASSLAVVTSRTEYATEVIVYIVLEVIIAILALVGNGLVLLAIWKYRTLRTPTNWLVASLAIADIAVAIFAIPSAILLRLGLSVTHVDCPYTPTGPSVGEWTCLIIITSVIFLTQVSIFSLTVIAIDRFIAINYPFKYQSLMTSKKFTKICTAVVWISGALIGLAPQLGWNQWVQGDSLPCDRLRCDFEEVTNMNYMVYFNFFGCVLLPLVVMAIIYMLIFRSAKRQLRRIYFDVKNLKTRSRSVELLHHLKVAKSEISISIHEKRGKKSHHNSLSHDDVTGSKFKVDNTEPNRHNSPANRERVLRSSESMHSDLTTGRTLVQSLSYSGDVSDNAYVMRQAGLSPHRLSTSNGDVASSVNFHDDAELRQKSASFSVSTTSLHPKALIMKKQQIHHLDSNPTSNGSSRSTVYTHDFVTEKGASNITNTTELRRKMKRKKQLLKKEFRAARSLATVVGVFAICWLPLHIMNTFTLLCPTCYQPPWSTDLAIVLSHANSMVNPFIYACSMQDYRKAFRKLLAYLGISCSPDSKCCCIVTSDDSNSPDTSFDERSKDHDRKSADRRNNNLNNNSNVSCEDGPVRNEEDALLRFQSNHRVSIPATSHQLVNSSELLLKENKPSVLTIKDEISDHHHFSQKLNASKETIL